MKVLSLAILLSFQVATAEPLDEPIGCDTEFETCEPEADPEPVLPCELIEPNEPTNITRSLTSDCNLQSQPKETSLKLGKVKSGKRLWTENHADWYLVYTSRGVGFLNKKCF